MICAQAAIVRTAIVRLSVEFKRHLGSLVVIPDVLIIFNIRCDQRLAETVFAAVLQHEHIVFFENNFGVDAFQASRAKADRKIVICVWTFRHSTSNPLTGVQDQKIWSQYTDCRIAVSSWAAFEFTFFVRSINFFG